MKLLNPNIYQGEFLDTHTNKMLEAVVGWFENKGLKSIKHDWHNTVWNYGFVEFLESQQVFATLMTPEG